MHVAKQMHSHVQGSRIGNGAILTKQRPSCMVDVSNTCNSPPAAEENLLWHCLVRWSAELGHHNGEHQVLGHLLPLHVVAEL